MRVHITAAAVLAVGLVIGGAAVIAYAGEPSYPTGGTPSASTSAPPTSAPPSSTTPTPSPTPSGGSVPPTVPPTSPTPTVPPTSAPPAPAPSSGPGSGPGSPHGPTNAPIAELPFTGSGPYTRLLLGCAGLLVGLGVALAIPTSRRELWRLIRRR